MEIQQLRYVVAVADELHFGRAAERLGVAQQSVSDQVRRLEREFGVPLFVRTSRKVAPTTAGAAFVLAARRALLAIDEAAATVHRVASGTSGQLRVGYAGDLGQRLIQHTVPRLRQLEAPIRVEPVPMSTPLQLVALTERRLDLAFGWTPDLTEGFAALLVTRDPLVLAVAADHPLAALRTVPPRSCQAGPSSSLRAHSTHGFTSAPSANSSAKEQSLKSIRRSLASPGCCRSFWPGQLWPSRA